MTTSAMMILPAMQSQLSCIAETHRGIDMIGDNGVRGG